MAKSTVLIVGQYPDAHIEEIQKHLQRLNVTTLVIDRYSGDTLTYQFKRGGYRGRFDKAGTGVDFQDVTAVWWRVKPAIPVEFSGGHGSEAERFRWSEWRQALASLPSFLAHALWINPIDKHKAASFKPRQLAAAIEVGFQVPDTIIANDPRSVLRLFERNSRVIYKTLSSYLIPPDEIIYTNEIQSAQVESCGESIRLAPGIYQGFIEKAYEIRITIVGNTIFPAKISSQEVENTRIDWRRDQKRDMYSVVNLAAQDKARLLKLHRRFGLVYAAYDFAVDINGQLIFLECNPGGQWLWIEHALGLPISQAVAAALSSATKKDDAA